MSVSILLRAALCVRCTEATKARGDEMFLAKYTEAGGNAREFVQRGLLQTVAM